MRKHMRIIFSFLILSFLSFNVIYASPIAVDGRLNLQDIDLESADSITLNGYWHFYEGGFLQQDQLSHNSYKVIETPATWGSQPLTMGNIGYGTYHLTIMLSEHELGRPLGLDLPSIASAYELYINGEKLASAGKIGTSSYTMIPAAKPQTVYFVADSQLLDVVVLVSNFSQRKGGIWNELKLGTADNIAKHKHQRLLFQTFVATGLLLMGMVHVGYYAFRTDKSTLYFGLACLLFFLRALLVGDMLLIQLIPAIPWEIAVKIEYISVYWGISFLVLYFYHLYQDNLNRHVTYCFTTLMLLSTLPVFVLPAKIYTHWMIVYQLIAISSILYILFGLVRAVLYRRMGAKVNLAAGLIFLATALNDILYYNFLLKSIDLVTLGLFLFIFTQMFMIARKFTFALHEVELLKDKLTATNVNLERIVEERTEELRKSNEKLRLSEQARTNLLSDITHEISNPLTSIIGYLRRLKDGVPADMQSRHIQVAYKKALMLDHVIGDLSQLAHFEQETLSYSFRVMMLHELSEVLQKTYDWDLLDREVTLHFQLPAEDNIYVNIDLQRLEQAFTNIVNNALVHTVQQAHISITGRYFSFASAYVIAIHDTGKGIAKEDQAHLFERFYRAKSDASTNYNGTGLGLTIAKMIMSAHEGRIGMFSDLGKGSTFYLILPVKREEACS